MAVIAFGAPALLFIRLMNAPIAVCVLPAEQAANRNAFDALFFTFRVLLLNTFAPLILLLGLKPNHEVKCFSVGHLLMSMPTSAVIACTVSSFRPGIAVKSTPVTAYKLSLRLNLGTFEDAQDLRFFFFKGS